MWTPPGCAIASVADNLAESKIGLVEELPRGPLTGWGDANRLQRAMVQLMENAAKFTPPGGAIGVRVVWLPSGHYEMCVADTGPGVAPDRMHSIFEPFRQGDGSMTREYGGVGVGLAIARRTARGLGGDVRVVSPSHEVIEGVALEGAAFYLTVAQRAPGEIPPPPGSTPTIPPLSL